MMKVRAGYAQDTPVLAVVADRAAAEQWAKDNGYGKLSIQMDPSEFRVARLTTAAEWSNVRREA